MAADATDPARAAADEVLRYVQERRTTGCDGCGTIGVNWDWAEIIRRHYQPLEAALRRVLEIHRTQPDGHCLFCGAVPCPTVQAVLEKLEGK